MFTLIGEAGLFGMLITVTILLALFYALLSVKNLISNSEKDKENLSENLRNVLRLGIFSAVTGVAGSFFGSYEAIAAIRRASEISPKVLMEGIQVMLSSSVLGFGVFIIAAVVWFVMVQIANIKFSSSAK